MFTLHRILLLSLSLSLVMACSGDDLPIAPSENEGMTNPVPVDAGTGESGRGESEEASLPSALAYISASPDHGILKSVLETADRELYDLLAEEDTEVTVFAPTDAAFLAFFESLEEFTGWEDFDEAAEIGVLAEIVRYHILQGDSFFTDDLPDGSQWTSVQTGIVHILVDAGVWVQNDTGLQALLIAADNEVSNGVVHSIDRVLWPEEVIPFLFPKPTLAEIIAGTKELDQFKQALVRADLFGTMEGEGPYTVFAPDDGAVAMLFEILGDPYDDFDDFRNFLEIQVLNDILLGHLVGSDIASEDFAEGSIATLLAGDSIELVMENDVFVIKDASETRAKFVTKDLKASNGTLHVIDKILLPRKALDFVD